MISSRTPITIGSDPGATLKIDGLPGVIEIGERDGGFFVAGRGARNLRVEGAPLSGSRELKDGARPVDHDPDIVVSPCDAIVGACGRIAGGELLQVKGFPYTLDDLLCGSDLVQRYRNGLYVTLRLTASMTANTR